MFKCWLFPEKLLEGVYYYIYCFCGRERYEVKISGQLDFFSGNWGKGVKKPQKVQNAEKVDQFTQILH